MYQAVKPPSKIMIVTESKHGADLEEMFAEAQNLLSSMKHIKLEVNLVETFQCR